MTTGARPGAVTAVLALLILIALYQIGMSLVALAGAVAMETVGFVAEGAQVPTWAVLTAAAIGLVYGAAAAVLGVMVARNRPRARAAVVAVNFGYAALILALLFTPVSAFPEIVTAALALTVASLADSESAKEYFSGTLPADRARPRVG
ncbi:hypothetical protein A6A08_13865 [Nocardiopsis sp. TSRI0078]|uniref:hypothetical protein n=1 Tax=unclassified Nocardiopsis TaxID=2649073 RepID=UPI000939F9D8|nr:hypothetical protein [Nocardiopsis sp. TSRI0078]OKI14629.1 hypothetical protein A6A08_13865 [Nocardiopsis sp. TSRI0078]